MKASKIVVRENYRQISDTERKNAIINNIVKLLITEHSKSISSTTTKGSIKDE